MKKLLFFCASMFLLFSGKCFSQSCSCKSVNNYDVEYPSTGNNQPTASHTFDGVPNPLPTSALTSGNSIHLWFPNGPCNGTVALACGGHYTATVNGTTFQSIGGNSNVDLHLQIPLSALVLGVNTIVIKGICQTGTQCNMNSLVVNVPPPAQPTAITLTPECCTVTKYWNTGDPSNPHESSTRYTGQVKFKVNGIPNGCIIKVTAGLQPVYEPIINGNFTACYNANPVTFVLVDAVTKQPVNGATINGQSIYTYRKGKNCLNLGPHQQASPVSGRG